MAYCRYGCPTGALLNFLAAGGRPDRFSRRDAMAFAFLLLAAGLYFSR
jgi:NosR/NirI family nitrous oxide reductase transcriptional regulator